MFTSQKTLDCVLETLDCLYFYVFCNCFCGCILALITSVNDKVSAPNMDPNLWWILAYIYISKSSTALDNIGAMSIYTYFLAEKPSHQELVPSANQQMRIHGCMYCLNANNNTSMH